MYLSMYLRYICMMLNPNNWDVQYHPKGHLGFTRNTFSSLINNNTSICLSMSTLDFFLGVYLSVLAILSGS